MVKQGDTIIMTVEELQLEREKVIITTIEKAQDLILNNKSFKHTLDTEGVANLFKCSRTTVDSYLKRKKNPLPMVGSPRRIEESEAWEWYKKHSGEYQG